MARIEVVEKRTAKSKTFFDDNDGVGDGFYILEAGAHFHMMKDGAWIEPDSTWKNSATEFLTGDYPYVIKVNKGTNAITLMIDGILNTVAPTQDNNKAVATYSGDTVTIPGLWTGVDLRVILGADYPRITFTKVAATATNPQFMVTGDATAMLFAQYIDALNNTIEVPVTYLNGFVTYNLSMVPVGGVVF